MLLCSNVITVNKGSDLSDVHNHVKYELPL